MNKTLLKARMLEKGIDADLLSQKTGMNIATFYRKLSGESDFYIKELKIIRDTLELSKEDFNSIFFDD